MQRIKWIDAAKAIAMISVILGHCGIATINRIVFPYHLMVFFLLSGYTLHRQSITKEYLQKKFRALMKPYFITVASIIGMDTINALRDGAEINRITAIWSADLLRGFAASGDIEKIGTVEIGGRIGAIWFLPAMFFALVFASVIVNFFYNARYPVSIGMMILAQASGQQFWLPFSIQSGVFATFFIVLGYDIRVYDVLRHVKTRHYVIAACVFLFGIRFNYMSYFVTAQMTDLGISTIVGLSGSLLVYGAAQLLQNSRLLLFTGRHSLIFLCVHLFELETMWVYFSRATEFVLSLPIPYWPRPYYILIRLLFIYLVSGMIVKIQHALKSAKEKQKVLLEKEKRSYEIDIEKALLIVLMLIGHYSIDQDLRNIIYSFHMVGFIVLSGYFYKPRKLTEQLKKDFQNILLPYLCFSLCNGVVSVVIENQGIKSVIQDALLGMSFSKGLLLHVNSVGPVYFILLLFCTKQIYALLRNYFPQYVNCLVVLFVIFGATLGKLGIWLPWSLDISLYAVGFYHIGYAINQFKILQKVKENPSWYFMISTIWAYMIYSGSMEVAIRKYSPYTIVVLGSVAGTIILYMLSDYIYHSLLWLPVKRAIILVGQSTIWVLIVHTLMERRVFYPIVSRALSTNGIYYMGVVICLNLLMGVLISCVWKYVNNTMRKVKSHRYGKKGI